MHRVYIDYICINQASPPLWLLVIYTVGSRTNDYGENDGPKPLVYGMSAAAKIFVCG